MVTFQLINTLLRIFRTLGLEVYLNSSHSDYILAMSPFKSASDDWIIRRTMYIDIHPDGKFYIRVELHTFGYYPNGEFGDITHAYTTNNLRKAAKKAYLFMQDEKEALAIK